MKCAHCNNILPKSNVLKSKIACQVEGCISFGINPRTKQFQIIVMGKSQQEVDDAWRKRVANGVKTQRLRGYYNDKSNNPGSKEYWLKRGLSKEKVDRKISGKNLKSAKTKKNNGFYDDKSNNPYSKEYWISTGKSINEAESIIRSKNHNCQEYWIKRGFSPNEANELAAESADTNSLVAKILRHGEQQGKAKYLETRKRLSEAWSPRSASGQKFGSSIQANKFIRKIYKYVRRLGYERDDVMCSSNRGEFYIHQENRIMFYDFCLRPLKIIIEFNGEHVHPNHENLSEEAFANWRHAYDKRTALEVMQADRQKVFCAEDLGYNVLSVWSKDPDNFAKIVNFIRNQHDRQNHSA